MRDEQMPHDGLKRLRVRRDVLRVHGGNEDARVGRLRGVAPVAAHDAEHRRAGLLRQLNRADEVGADVLFQIAAADGEDEERVLRLEPAAFEPLCSLCGWHGEFRY